MPVLPLFSSGHNESFERTPTGMLQLGFISFLPNRSLPPRAAQLRRYVVSPTDVYQHSLYHLHIYPVIAQEASC